MDLSDLTEDELLNIIDNFEYLFFMTNVSDQAKEYVSIVRMQIFDELHSRL